MATTKPIKQQQKRSISRYCPPQSPPQTFRAIDEFEYDASSPTVCPHALFSSPSMFVEHLLFILHPKSRRCHIPESHLESLISLMTIGICTNCVLGILCRVPFKDVLNLYSLSMRETSYMFTADVHRPGIGALLYVPLFSHPKIPRIMPKMCKLSAKTYANGERISAQNKLAGKEGYVHDFDFVCDIICERISKAMYSSDGDLSSVGTFYHTFNIQSAGRFLRVLYLSSKYWNKYQMLFFVRHFLLDLYEEFEKARKLSLQNQVPYVLNINMYMLLQCCLRRIVHKAQKLRRDEIQNLEVVSVLNGYLKQQDNENITSMEKALDWIKPMKKSTLRCASYACCKEQKSMQQPFKVCQGCKMAYYCSRHCQKVSWKTDHKSVCFNLRKYYEL